MTNLVAIDNKNHKDITVDGSKAEMHGANVNLIPVVVPEFSNLATQYPIVITKNGDTGQFVFAAMLGLETNENLFWQDEQWQGLYLPLQIQRQPFFVGEMNNEQIMCIDLESPTLSSNDGVAIFNSDGSDSEYLQDAKEKLALLLQGELQNIELIDAITSLDLLQPLSVEITLVNEQSCRLNGLYTIDNAKLAALGDAQVVNLHRQGQLDSIYTMITSLGQIYGLIDKKNKQVSAQL